jgi:hypothetical protein
MIAQQLVSHEAAWIFNWWRTEYVGLTFQEANLNVNFIFVFSTSSMQQTVINNVSYIS